MKNFNLWFAGIIVWLLLIAGAVQAFPRCGTFSQVTEYLGGYGQVPVNTGIASGAVVTLFVNEVSATWTVAVTTGGETCMVAFGEGWKAYERK